MLSDRRMNAQPDVDLEQGGRQSQQNVDEQPSAPATDVRESAGPQDANEASNGIRKHYVPSNPGRPIERRTPQRPVVDSRNTAAQRRRANHPMTPAEMSVFHAPAVHDPDPAAERLADDESPLSDEEFHQLMGMRKPASAHEEQLDEKYPFKLAAKHGLYRTICDDLRFIQYKYRIFDVTTYVLLALQIIIGAIFIILGALRDERSYIVIAVLGAVSTVTGGILALMKGQGLPNRLRQARDQMRNVKFEAEELYWDFRSGQSIIYSDVKKIREDYLRVMEEMRRNHPDTWTNAALQAANPPRGRGGRG